MSNDDPTNVLVLERRGNRYVFIFTDNRTDGILQTIGRFASSRELNFTWYDAYVLAKRIRRMTNQEL